MDFSLSFNTHIHADVQTSHLNKPVLFSFMFALFLNILLIALIEMSGRIAKNIQIPPIVKIELLPLPKPKYIKENISPPVQEEIVPMNTPPQKIEKQPEIKKENKKQPEAIEEPKVEKPVKAKKIDASSLPKPVLQESDSIQQSNEYIPKASFFKIKKLDPAPKPDLVLEKPLPKIKFKQPIPPLSPKAEKIISPPLPSQKEEIEPLEIEPVSPLKTPPIETETPKKLDISIQETKETIPKPEQDILELEQEIKVEVSPNPLLSKANHNEINPEHETQKALQSPDQKTESVKTIALPVIKPSIEVDQITSLSDQNQKSDQEQSDLPTNQEPDILASSKTPDTEGEKQNAILPKQNGSERALLKLPNSYFSYSSSSAQKNASKNQYTGKNSYTDQSKQNKSGKSYQKQGGFYIKGHFSPQKATGIAGILNDLDCQDPDHKAKTCDQLVSITPQKNQNGFTDQTHQKAYNGLAPKYKNLTKEQLNQALNSPKSKNQIPILPGLNLQGPLINHMHGVNDVESAKLKPKSTQLGKNHLGK